jgi:hypothetical protein
MTLEDIIKNGNADISKAFGEGSDARIRGEPLSSNPYSSEFTHESKAWKRGWHDIDIAFGSEARWPVRNLPDVRKK